MANVLATTAVVAKESLAVLKNMLSFSANVNRDWEDEFTENKSRGYAPGQTINIKRPPRYQYRAGRVAVPQGTVQNTVPLTLQQGGCDLQFTSGERTLSLDKLSDKLQAAMAEVTNEIDRQGLALAHYSTFNTLNPTGAMPNTQDLSIGAMTDLNARLDEMGAPRVPGSRTLISAPRLNGNLVRGMAGLFNPNGTIAKQNNNGMQVPSFGLNVGMDQNVDSHTNGTQVVTGTAVNGANQTGSAITVAALGGTITRGTVITLPGVFAVNPKTRNSTGVLAQFVVTADLAAGAVSIPVSPALVTNGAFQNVTASPTNGQNFLIVGAASTTYQTNIAYHKDAFTLAMVPMATPQAGSGATAHQETSDGFTVKVTEFYDGTNDVSIMRLDVLFGWAATYPELSAKYYTT
ncbi:P22 phage major capsid protein family protein [Massilia sp. GER05]|uniref:P22 phage major capsid protein family protein n=1 Tax=Massilia sp. GER05 TaxID=3394605 RepID=UPI003F83B203